MTEPLSRCSSGTNTPPEVVAAVQEALMRHPFWRPGLGSSGLAFGFANTAIEAYLKAMGGVAQPSSDTAEAVLNEIRDALETRNYFHMANGRDIGLLLDELERLQGNAQDVPAVAATPSEPEGDFYLVPREIIEQFPEINVNNYDHDDACALNAWGCEVVTNANPSGGVAQAALDPTAKGPDDCAEYMLLQARQKGQEQWTNIYAAQLDQFVGYCEVRALAMSSTSRACTCGADIALDYHQDWCPAFPSTTLGSAAK